VSEIHAVDIFAAHELAKFLKSFPEDYLVMMKPCTSGSQVIREIIVDRKTKTITLSTGLK